MYLDVCQSDVLNRLQRMKVARIVGQNDGVSMQDILTYRSQFYERLYDVRVPCARDATADDIAENVIATLTSREDLRRFVSTRSLGCSDLDFNDVILKGLAPDGGLFVTERIPAFSQGELQRLVELNYPERALRVLEKWIHFDDLHPSQLRQMIESAYGDEKFEHDDVTPVRRMGDNRFLLELFHGPTASFKDLALQLLPHFFAHARTRHVTSKKIDADSKYVYLLISLSFF